MNSRMGRFLSLFFTALTSMSVPGFMEADRYLLNLLNDYKTMGKIWNTLGTYRRYRDHNLLRKVRADFV